MYIRYKVAPTTEQLINHTATKVLLVHIRYKTPAPMEQLTIHNHTIFVSIIIIITIIIITIIIIIIVCPNARRESGQTIGSCCRYS